MRNTGDGAFADLTIASGLAAVISSQGGAWGDYDNDGWLDLYLPGEFAPERPLADNRSKLYHKNHDGTFTDVAERAGVLHERFGKGSDWDRDGDVDVFLESGGATPGDKAGKLLFQNPGHGNHWLNVKLNGVTTNRSALGARIWLQVIQDDGSISPRHRVVTSGSSFGGNPLATTIGLGRARSIATLKVQCPTSKTEQVFHDIEVDRAIEITEGKSSYRTLEWTR